MRHILKLLPLLLLPILALAALEVPVDLQVSILKKVLKFDSTLPDAEHCAVLVVHSGDAKTANALAGAFKGAGFKPVVCEVGALPGALAGAKVAYFCPGAESAAGKLPGGVLSLCGTRSAVEQNRVAVGVGMVDAKPKLLVSLSAYTACGHSIDSQVLGLAKIIR
ncbi:MAG: hypothetical protein WC326_11125 [Candidatus Delongbacteria bacterium]